jgi:hypothetical protein
MDSRLAITGYRTEGICRKAANGKSIEYRYLNGRNGIGQKTGSIRVALT